MKHLSLFSITALIIAMLCSCESTISEADSSRDVSVSGKTFVRKITNAPNDYMEYRFTNDSVYFSAPCLDVDDWAFKSAYTQENEFVYFINKQEVQSVIISYGKFIMTASESYFLKE